MVTLGSTGQTTGIKMISSKDVHYVAIDPGKRIGFMEFTSEGVPYWPGFTFNFEELQDYLDNIQDPKIIIVEDYVINPHVKQGGSRGDAMQVIGYLKAWCRKRNIKLALQKNTVLSIAFMWSGVKKPKGHLPDVLSAYLHGYYYLHKNGIIRARVLDE